MKVSLYDVADPERPIGGRYTIDTTFGVPAVGDDIYLRVHDYDSTKKAYLAGTVRRRSWILSDDAPAGAELEIWVQRHGK